MEHSAQIAQAVIRSVIRSTVPLLPGGLDDVADTELILEENEEAGDQVLDQALGPEREGQAQDAAGGEQRPDGDELPGVSRPTISRISSRPALRTIWATVWPRRSAAVMVESSPSSTAAMIRRAMRRTAWYASQPASQIPRTFRTRSTTAPAAGAEELGDVGKDVPDGGGLKHGGAQFGSGVISGGNLGPEPSAVNRMEPERVMRVARAVTP